MELQLEANVHILVKDAKGCTVQNEKGEWLIMDTENQRLLYVFPSLEVLNFFRMAWESPVSPPSELSAVENEDSEASIDNDANNSSNKPMHDHTSNVRVHWTEYEIHHLIQLYKEHTDYFKNTAVKNDKVWKMVALKLKTHTSEQCKNKMKYLKDKYIKRKESMGDKNTGGTLYKFDYFDELDEIFGKQPNITPISIASSSNGNKNVKTIDVEAETETPKKKKKSNLEKQLEGYEISAQGREISREKRHQEIINRQDQALDIFKRIADSFEKIANKNN